MIYDQLIGEINRNAGRMYLTSIFQIMNLLWNLAKLFYDDRSYS